MCGDFDVRLMGDVDKTSGMCGDFDGEANGRCGEDVGDV